MEMSWSRWFRCESSFGLLLVPNQPGVYALAEETMVQEAAESAGTQMRRTLAVFEAGETPDLARALSRLFAAGSPWRQKLNESSCYVRYAVTGDAEERRAAAGALRHWLNAQREPAAQIVNKGVSVASVEQQAGEMQSERCLARAAHEGEAAERCGALEEEAELKTVAERAVDRVTRATEYAGVFPASI